MIDQVKPCPFCGELPRVFNAAYLRWGTNLKAICYGSKIHFHRPISLEIAEWNTRG